MVLAFLTFFTGIAISTIAIYYSVLGLASIFSAAALSVIIMGTVLEISKLVTAWWLKANWYRTPWSLKGYLTIAVITLMLITSMGIFGYLSKAHSDQSLVSGDVQAKISLIDEKIKISRENIESARNQLKQLDAAVDQVMSRSTNEQGAARSDQIRRSQARDRARLLKEIETEQGVIQKLNEQAAPIRAEVRAVEAEVGPIKYIAALIYGDNPDTNLLEKAVVWVILTIVFVFDPLAVLLLLASQMSFQWAFQERKEKASLWDKVKEEMRPKGKDEPAPEEPKYEKDDGPLPEEVIEQIKETAPKPAEPSKILSYLDKPGVFFKWRPAPNEETAPAKEVKIEEPVVEPAPVVEIKVEEPIIVPPEPIIEVKTEEPIVLQPEIVPVVEQPIITVDTTEIKIETEKPYLSPVPVATAPEPKPETDTDTEKKRVATDDEDRVILVEDDETRYINELKQREKDLMKAWKDSNPNDTIKQQIKLKKMGLVDRLPWQIDELERIRARDESGKN
jgi:hypothetical protein